jgi:hypothetical protein
MKKIYPVPSNSLLTSLNTSKSVIHLALARLESAAPLSLLSFTADRFSIYKNLELKF